MPKKKVLNISIDLWQTSHCNRTKMTVEHEIMQIKYTEQEEGRQTKT